MDAKKDYLDLINEFIRKTSEGILSWKKQNPTTLYLESKVSEDETAVISIQKLQTSRKIRVGTSNMSYKNITSSHYLFTVKRGQNKDLVIQMDSSSDKDYEPALKELFEAAKYTIEKKNIDFLKNLMDNL